MSGFRSSLRLVCHLVFIFSFSFAFRQDSFLARLSGKAFEFVLRKLFLHLPLNEVDIMNVFDHLICVVQDLILSFKLLTQFVIHFSHMRLRLIFIMTQRFIALEDFIHLLFDVWHYNIIGEFYSSPQ